MGWSHVWTWEFDCEESWVPENWCFWTVVLEKTLESLLDCKELQPVSPKGDQSWIFIGRTDVGAETLILWLPDTKSWLIWKNLDAGKDWRREEKGMKWLIASPTPVYSNSCPLSRWCHPTISSSVVPFSSRLQSFPASGSFLRCQFFASGGPKYWRFSFSISLLMNIQDWFPLGLIDLILQSKGLSRVSSNTTVQKHQFSGTQPSLRSNSHIHTWLLAKP